MARYKVMRKFDGVRQRVAELLARHEWLRDMIQRGDPGAYSALVLQYWREYEGLKAWAPNLHRLTSPETIIRRMRELGEWKEQWPC